MELILASFETRLGKNIKTRKEHQMKLTTCLKCFVLATAFLMGTGLLSSADNEQRPWIFRTQFEWDNSWGDPDSDFYSLSGKKYRAKEYYEKCYDYAAKEYDTKKYPHKYRTTYQSDPAWKGKFKYEYSFRHNKIPLEKYMKDEWEYFHYRERDEYEVVDVILQVLSGISGIRSVSEETILSDIVRWILMGYPVAAFEKNEGEKRVRELLRSVLSKPQKDITSRERRIIREAKELLGLDGSDFRMENAANQIELIEQLEGRKDMCEIREIMSQFPKAKLSNDAIVHFLDQLKQNPEDLGLIAGVALLENDNCEPAVQFISTALKEAKYKPPLMEKIILSAGPAHGNVVLENLLSFACKNDDADLKRCAFQSLGKFKTNKDVQAFFSAF